MTRLAAGVPFKAEIPSTGVGLFVFLPPRPDGRSPEDQSSMLLSINCRHVPERPHVLE